MLFRSAWSYFFVAKAQPQYRILPHVQDRLTSIAAFTNRIRNQRGLVPQLGDNDSGRFLPFLPMREQHAPWEHMMDRRDVCRLILEVSATSFPATLSPASAMLAEYQSNLSLPPSSYHADDFGLVILRTTHFEMYGRAGSIGQLGRGGHSHNDQLSLVLCVDGYEFICDPGTFIYTALPEIGRAHV